MTLISKPKNERISPRSNMREDRWCIETQERSLSLSSKFNFDSKFGDSEMRRGYELVGKINMEAHIA